MIEPRVHLVPESPQRATSTSCAAWSGRSVWLVCAECRVDVVAVDAYWWWPLQRHDPDVAAAVRAIGETAAVPMPPIVCSAGFPEALAHRLATALTALREDSAALPHLEALGIHGFAAVARADYSLLAEIERVARAADYPIPG